MLVVMGSQQQLEELRRILGDGVDAVETMSGISTSNKRSIDGAYDRPTQVHG